MTINDFDLNSIQRIGLDMIKLSGLAVAEIDIPKLAQDRRVDISLAHNSSRKCKRHMPGTDVGIAKITVKDNMIFSDLIIGCADTGSGAPIEYAYLTLAVSDAKGCNLENMSYQEYDDYIACTLWYIKEEYDIVLMDGLMKIDYMEINSNIFLAGRFQTYNRVSRLFMSFFNNHMGKLNTYEKITNVKTAEGESFTRGNQSTEVTIYDKTKQLEDTGSPLDENIPIMRIELKLKNKKKIQSAFGSCYWKDIDDKKIAGYYHREIYTQLSKKLNTWLDTRNKELKKLILASRKKSKKSWNHILMQEIRNKSEMHMIPYILDIEQVCNAFRQLPDPHRNAGRSIRSLINISVDEDIYKNHDIDKASEILNWLAAYYNQCCNHVN